MTIFRVFSSTVAVVFAIIFSSSNDTAAQSAPFETDDTRTTAISAQHAPVQLPKLTAIRLSSFYTQSPSWNFSLSPLGDITNLTVKPLVVRLLWLSSKDKLGTNFYDFEQSVGAVNVGLARLASERVLSKYSNVDLEVAHTAITVDGGCSAYGDLNVIHRIYNTLQYDFDAVIGPPCAEGALAVCTFVESLGKPPLVWVAPHQDFDLKNRYPHVTQTFVDVGQFGTCVLGLLRQLGNWTRVAFLSDSDSYVCSTLVEPLMKILVQKGAVTVAYSAILSGKTSTNDDLRSAIVEASQVARIMFTCTTASAAKTGYGPAAKYDPFSLRIMSQAYRLGIHTGEYQWVALRVSLTNIQWPPYAPLQANVNDLLNDKYSVQAVIDDLKLPVTESELYEIYRSVLEFDQDWGTSNDAFSEQVMTAAFQPPWNINRSAFDAEVQSGYRVGRASTFAGHLADGIYLYGRGVRDALEKNLDYGNSTVMYNLFQRIPFEGKSGYFAVNRQGKRLCDVLLYAPVKNYYNVHPLKRFSRRGVMRCASLAATAGANGGKLDLVSPLEWYGTPDGRPPPDTPVCGWHYEHCQLLSTTAIVLIACAGVFVIVLLFTVLCLIQRRKRRLAALLNTDWNLQPTDLAWKKSETNASRRTMSNYSNKTEGSFGTITTVFDTTQAINALDQKVALFKGKLNVHVKSVQIDPLSEFVVRRPSASVAIHNVIHVQTQAQTQKTASTASVANLPLRSLRELRAMKDADHDNINRFVGIVMGIATNPGATAVAAASRRASGKADREENPATDAVPLMLVVTTYCSKGSLADVLHAGAGDDAPLDWLFKYSFMCDIANGLQYLHTNSALKWHGRLSSSGIVLDARWTAKLTDFGLWSFGKHSSTSQWFDVADLEDDLTSGKIDGEKLLWTAPEVLRNPSTFVDFASSSVRNIKPPKKSSSGNSNGDHRMKSRQAADIYSFGVVLSEIVYQTMPYKTEQELRNCNAVEIVKLLAAAYDKNALLRPEHTEIFAAAPKNTQQRAQPTIQLALTTQEQVQAARAARQLMMECWQESVHERPNIRQVLRQLRQMNKDRKSEGIVDRIINKLEAYAENLEAVVRERTSELMDEKQRADALLSRMLPASVAERLKVGEPVIPEHYEETTIFFSDIVSFTTISSLSTPMQVVQLLNDLYTFMDGTLDRYAPHVYKVETIGDAYMIVSGVPLRTQMHARILSSVALAILANIVHAVRIAHVVIDPVTHQPMHHVRIRVGLNSGPCVAGVVGLQMPRYCLFGDTVNVASRMESNGEPMRIHISRSTREALRRWPSYVVEDRGIIDIKGKGEMNTFWLVNGPHT